MGTKYYTVSSSTTDKSPVTMDTYSIEHLTRRPWTTHVKATVTTTTCTAAAAATYLSRSQPWNNYHFYSQKSLNTVSNKHTAYMYKNTYKKVDIQRKYSTDAHARASGKNNYLKMS